MAKLKYDKLNEFVKSREELETQVEVYEKELGKLKKAAADLQAQIDAAEKENKDMVESVIKMDAIKFLANQNKVKELKVKLAEANADVKSFDDLGEKFKEDVYTPLLENAVPVKDEFYNNCVALQKSLFKAFSDAERITDDMHTLSKKYKDEFYYIPHSRAQYYGFDVVGKMGEVFGRFAIPYRSNFGYNQSVTSELYPFEK